MSHEARHLLDLFGAARGTVCAAGAGGKKTLLYRLAAMHGGRVGITNTVFMAPFPESLGAETVIAPAESLMTDVRAAAARSRRVAFSHPSDKRERNGGLSIAELEAVQAQGWFDVLLVKADGARMRAIKAPDPDEPVLPIGVDTVLYLVSAAAIGKPLDEQIAHRIERLEIVTGMARGQAIRPEHMARLLSHPQGALQHVGSARLVPVINAVDDDGRRGLARVVAEQALAATQAYDQVLLTCLNRSNPLVEIVRR